MDLTNKVTNRLLSGVILLLVSTLAEPAAAKAPSLHGMPQIPKAMKADIQSSFLKAPLSFEANQGQTDSQVKFLSRGSGYTLFLTSTEAVLVLKKPQVETNENISDFLNAEKPEEVFGNVLRMKFVGATIHTHAWRE